MSKRTSKLDEAMSDVKKMDVKRKIQKRKHFPVNWAYNCDNYAPCF